MRSHVIIEAMADRGIAWTPTFAPVHFQWARPELVGWSPLTVMNIARILSDHSENLLRAEAGASPACGQSLQMTHFIHQIDTWHCRNPFPRSGTGH